VTRSAAERDRDEAGRPKNARPRDGLGRPLERGSIGVPVTPDDLSLESDEAVMTAQRLIDAGRPFHAHEVLEAVWKSAPADQRDLWKGLAQIAVGLTHARRGNNTGAVALLRRGAEAVGGHATGAQHGSLPAALDVAGARRAALDLADRIAGSGLASLEDSDLRVPLAIGH
jgi:hypothetical protein